MIGNMKVGARLAAVFAVVVVLLAIVSATAYVKIRAISASIDEIVNGRYQKVRLAYDVRDGVNAQINLVRAIVIDAGLPEHNDKRYGELTLAAKKTAEAIQGIVRLESTTEGLQALRELASVRTAFDAKRSEFIALAQMGGGEVAANFALNDMTAAQNAYLGAVTALALAQDRKLREEGVLAVAQGALAIRVTLTCSLFALILAIALGYLLSRSIVRPLHDAVRMAGNVAAGDLTTRIATRSEDETGKLVQALATMNDNLLAIVAQVRAGAERITVASQHIAAGNLELAARTEQQAGSLQETAAAMEQMTSTVRMNADHANQANQMAQCASATAVQGGQVVSQVIDTMASIHASSQRVSDIISVIDGIAFQTNILALNAAVEAARAGEQGRGFAVVAAEVRQLAQRSAAAAGEVKHLIGDSVAKVAVGRALVAQAGATMQQIVASVSRLSDVMGNISSASAEQSAGIADINRAIVRMDSVTQQNASQVEAAAVAVRAMREEALQLSETIGIFKC